jgi:alanyl-tRNA synthetase
MSMAEAIEGGADAFFDEKYGETVRTIRVEEYSFELCGGTHCRASGQIGGFLITSERSIGSGTRRIEAVTGAGADAVVRARLDTLERAAEAAGAQSVDAVPERIGGLQDELREAKKRLRAGGGAGLATPDQLVAAATEVAPGIRLVAYAAPYESMEALKGAARAVSKALGSGVVALAIVADEPQLFVTVSPDLVQRGISAGDLVRAAMPAIDGRGGGRAEMAQGSGQPRAGLSAALDAVRAAIQAIT